MMIEDDDDNDDDDDDDDDYDDYDDDYDDDDDDDYGGGNEDFHTCSQKCMYTYREIQRDAERYRETRHRDRQAQETAQ